MPPTNPNELFDVCDENDQVIGQATRAEVHSHGLVHRAVHIWVWNSQKQLLMHLRSETKDEYPLCYTSSASGHVDAGEDYETAAHRELSEELQLSGELSYQTKLPASPQTANEHTVLYFLDSDAEPTPDPEEIAAIEFLTVEQVLVKLKQSPEKFSPPFRELLTQWFLNSQAYLEFTR